MITYLLILFAVISRFVPHLPNFAPITALAIFSAANLDFKKALGITLAARFISDIFLGFFSWPLMLAVYGSHLFGLILGVYIKRSQSARWLKIVGASVTSSLTFFAVTNFAFFYHQYEHNFTGVTQAYINGLPFLKGTLLGDLAYTVLLFGALYLAKFLSAKKVYNYA